MDRIDDNEQLSSSMGDNTTIRTKQINSQIQEVTIERTKTLTYGIEDNCYSLRAEEFLAYITTLKLQHHIVCVQKFIVGNLTMLVVTCQTPYNKDQLRQKIDEARITFNGQILKEYSNRELKALQKIPVIKVMIFEAPFELDNFHIRQKLSYYGKIKDQEVYQQKFKGLDIYNGIRSINFLSLNKPLPTTMYVKGNRIKLKHIGQDRTPICAVCKNKGHYSTECPQIQNHEDMDNQIEKEEEQINREEENELEERINQDPMERTEEERREEEEKFPRSSWVTDENRIWDEEVTAEKNGTCLSPTQKTDSDWTEVKGKKKESKDNNKKKFKKEEERHLSRKPIWRTRYLPLIRILGWNNKQEEKKKRIERRWWQRLPWKIWPLQNGQWHWYRPRHRFDKYWWAVPELRWWEKEYPLKYF